MSNDLAIKKNRGPFWDIAVFAAAVLAASVLEFHVYFIFHLQNAERIAQDTIGLLHGHPYWRAFQNRLIGPWIVNALTGLVHGESRALFTFAGMGIVLANAGAAWLGVIYLGNRAAAMVMLAAFVLGYMLLFDYWTYSWDFLEVILFLAFSFAVLEGKSPLYILPIFVVSTLNRESAIFMGLWFAIDAIVSRILDQGSKFQIGKLTLSALLTAAAAAYTIVSRRKLFVSSPTEGSDVDHQTLGNHIDLLHNFELWKLAAIWGLILFVLSALFTAKYAAYFYRRRSATDIAFAVLIVVTLTQMMLFAVLGETRTFYTVLPMIYVAALRWLRDFKKRYDAGLGFTVPGGPADVSKV